MNCFRMNIMLFNVLSVFCYKTYNKCWLGECINKWMSNLSLQGKSR